MAVRMRASRGTHSSLGAGRGGHDAHPGIRCRRLPAPAGGSIMIRPCAPRSL
jgi:hypothetical protein